MEEAFFFGMLAGFGAAAFPGPINLEVVRRAVSHGSRAGAAFGFGAVSADVAYVLGITSGVAAILTTLPDWGKAIIYLVGAVLLLLLGITALRSKSVGVEIPESAEAPVLPTAVPPAPNVGIFKGYFLGLALTLSSPSTIAYWVFVSVPATQFAEGEGYVALPLAAGVALACTIWVALAATIAGLFHRRLNPQTYIIIERITGIGLCGFAFYAAFQAIRILLRWGFF